MAAVVHGHQRNRVRAGAKAAQHHRADDAHRVTRGVRALGHVRDDDRHQLAGHVAQRVALLRDGEGDHLQGGIDENLRKARHLARVLRVGAQALGDGGDDLAAGGGVRIERDVHGQAVERIVDFGDNLVVEGIRRDDAAVGQAFIEQLLLQGGNEAAEDIARTEVHPDRVLLRRVRHGLHVILRHGDAHLLPRSAVRECGTIHFHGSSSLREY